MTTFLWGPHSVSQAPVQLLPERIVKGQEGVGGAMRSRRGHEKVGGARSRRGHEGVGGVMRK